MNGSALRICIIGLHYSPEPSGNAPYTSSLAEGLSALGHDVTVITGYPHYPEWRLRSGYSGWSRNEKINAVTVQRLRHFIPTKPRALARMHMELSFGFRVLLAHWGRPDVVLLVSPALFSTGLAALRARLSPRRPRLGIWVQDFYSRGLLEMKSAPSFAAKLAAHLEGRIMRAAHGVVAIHDRFKDFMVNSLGIPPESVRVIRNWTHLPETPPFLREEIRRRLGWRQDDIVVLHAGNMGRKQGLENVVAAAGLAQERRSRVRFVLMGDGNQRNMLEKMATNVRNITFLDPLPDGHFQQALGAADFLLVNELPGIREMSVPSKLTSYFDAGVPVIAATDLGSVTASEIELSGGGVRVNAGSPADLLSMAERLSSDRERSKNMGRRGHQFRLEILSEASAIRQYDEFLVELASQATNRRSVS